MRDTNCGVIDRSKTAVARKIENVPIGPGDLYWVSSPYGDGVIQVRVIERSKSVIGHWACRRLDSSRILLPPTAFLQPVE